MPSFEDTTDYVPNRIKHMTLLAEATTRLQSWKTNTIPDAAIGNDRLTP